MRNWSKLKFTALSFVVLAIVLSPIQVFADDGIEALRETSKAFSSVAKKAIPAVVSVKVKKTVKSGSSYHNFEDEFFDRFFGPGARRPAPQPRPQQGQGSGFLISQDGYILTNHHVVGNADSIDVTLQDGKEFKAKIIGTDPKSDVALIKIESEDLPFVELGDSDALEIGEWVIAVGSPFGLQATVTVGVVSAKNRGVQIAEYEDFIQTDAAINPGNSGGPLLNIDGQAIGLNTAIFSQSGGYMGIGFAIPINIAKNIKDQLIESGTVSHGFLGIMMQPEKITKDLAEAFGLEENKGVLITKVLEDSPADNAGLKKDDVILKLDGKDAGDWQSFRSSIGILPPGTEVELVVFREGKEKTIKVTIGSLEDSDHILGVSQIAGKLGLQVEELTEETASRYGYEGEKGVIVTEVTEGSPAAVAGIEPNMLIASVNRKDVSSVEEFNKALEETAETRKAILLVRNKRFAQYVVLNLD